VDYFLVRVFVWDEGLSFGGFWSASVSSCWRGFNTSDLLVLGPLVQPFLEVDT
jgi:hypothetical protein